MDDLKGKSQGEKQLTCTYVVKHTTQKNSSKNVQLKPNEPLLQQTSDMRWSWHLTLYSYLHAL